MDQNHGGRPYAIHFHFPNDGMSVMAWLTSLFVANMLLAALGVTLMFRAARQREDLNAANLTRKILESTDDLTGLPNRENLRVELTKALKQQGDDLALLFVDLDGFKEINDTLGHAVGDDLLIQMSKRLTEKLGDDGLVARMGGDEFAALLRGENALDRAVKFARSLEGVITAPFNFDRGNVTLNASIGISHAEGEATDVTEMLRRADVAMYVAKAEGHTRYRVYSSDMDETLRLRRSVSAELEVALLEGGLRLVYQPLVCARTGRLVSAEALMRWPAKEGAAGTPGVFIPIAEETDLIIRLGDWALNEALIQIKALGNIPIAVNVSPVQFRVEGFAKFVEEAIRRHGVSPELLRIEITEGVLIEHTEQAQKTMRDLRKLGVQVLLDDFGTGYSSLSYLQQFEFDGLKIDRAFIQQLETGRMGPQLLKSIIALGHSLNMKVIAEGVETEDQAALLQLLRCDMLQGYALGRPGSVENLTQMHASEEMMTRAAQGRSLSRA